MQKYLYLLYFVLISYATPILAQNVGIGTPTPNMSAKLDISSTNSGLLIPRISLTDISNGTTPVATPATGLLVFNTNAAITGGSGIGFYYWDGSIWARVQDVNSSGGAAWSLTGNAGTGGTNFMGTTDSRPLRFRTNNIEQMRIRPNGNVGIGTTTPQNKLHVDGGANNTILRIGSNASYAENLYDVPTGSWEVGANDAGNGTNNNQFYIYDNAYRLTVQKGTGNVGIGTVAPANLFHLSGNTSDIMRIETTAASSDINYIAPSGNWQVGTNDGGNGTSSNHFYIYDNAYRFTVQAGTGDVGIGIAAPTSKLHVNGWNANVNVQSPSFNAGVIFNPSNASWRLGTERNAALDIFALREGGAIRLAIVEGSGNLGLGGVIPTYQLQLTGNAAKPGGGGFVAVSDKRLKENIQPYKDGLAAVLAINPIKYHYNKKSNYDTSIEYVGVIAQELKEVAPYMIGTFEQDSTEYFDVDNSAMTYMLINAVKEQQIQIEDANQKVALLKEENQVLKATLQQENAAMKASIEDLKKQLGLDIQGKK